MSTKNGRIDFGAEWGGVWGGMSPQPTEGSGERHDFSQLCQGQSLPQKRILAYFEGHRTLPFSPIFQCLSSSNSVSCRICETRLIFAGTARGLSASLSSCSRHHERHSYMLMLP